MSNLTVSKNSVVSENKSKLLVPEANPKIIKTKS